MNLELVFIIDHKDITKSVHVDKMYTKYLE